MATRARPAIRQELIEGVTVVCLLIPEHAWEAPFEEVDRLCRASCKGLDEPLRDPGHRRVLLDLSGLSYLCGPWTSQGVRLWKRVREAGGTLKVCGLSPPILQVLQLIRLDRLAELHPDRSAEPEDVIAVFAETFPAELPGVNLTGPAGQGLRHLPRAIRGDGRFGDLPVLADALEEAGCTDPEVLLHGHRGGLHGRDCWVLARRNPPLSRPCRRASRSGPPDPGAT
jgi:hypothetical protein